MKKSLWLILLAASITLIGCNTSNESKGDKYNIEGNMEEAIKYYTLAIEENTTNTEAINKLALAYSNNHQPEKAKECYILSSKNGDEDATRMLGAISFKDGDYTSAVSYYKPFGDKGDKEVAYNLGSSYFRLKQYDEALKYLMLDENSVYTKDIIGQVYYAKGDFDNAEKYWKSAVENHSSGAINSYNSLLKLYKEQRRMDDYNRYNGVY